MRTAKKIFNGYKRLIDSDVSAYWCTEKDFIEAINEARKEVINECAKKAEVQGVYNNGRTTYSVNKKPILSLIEKVK